MISYFRLRKIKKKPIRMCRSLHTCMVCDKKITDGQKYYDGGPKKDKAHVKCLNDKIELFKRKKK